MKQAQRSLVAAVVVLLLHALLASTDAAVAASAHGREAYVTLLYGDFYVLPVRVMMQSLLMNSRDVSEGLRERVVIVTGPTSERAISQLRQDGITVRQVPTMKSPYIDDAKFRSRFDNVMTKLYVFNMTDYTRLVFIDADSLILDDLSSVFSCGTFCATFINPWYFNSGFMMITPNTSLFQQMQHALPKTDSYDGGDQGFLNSFIPMLMDAPFFDPSATTNPPPSLARLPFSYHVDHSSFFPTNAFEFQKSNRCGPPRNIEWLGPPITKPWLWWTYSVFDLSWTWNHYRRQLSDAYPPQVSNRRDAVLQVVMCYMILIWYSRGFSQRRSSPYILATHLPRISPFRNVPARFSLVLPVISCIILWWVGFMACSFTVPRILQPYPATVVFFHLRFVHTLTMLVVGGFWLCAGQNNAGRARSSFPGKGRVRRWALWRMVRWSVVDAAFLIVSCGLMWRVKFPTMWVKGYVSVFVVVSQIVITCVMFTRCFSMWLRLTDVSGALDTPS